MDTAEQNNTHIAERVDAQTQTECTAEDLTLSQKLTPIANHELQLESAAQRAAPPPPTSNTTTTNTPLDKFDKDILRWKDVHFLRDFGDWFNPEKAVQPTYTRLLSSCGYYDPNSPLDLGLVEDHIPPLDLVDNLDTSIPNQGERALVSSNVMNTGSVTNVEKGFGQCFTPKAEDTTVVEPTTTDTDTPTNTISTGSTQIARSPTVTVGPSLDATSLEDNPDSDSDPTVLVESRTKMDGGKINDVE